MKTFVINLARAVERRRRMEEQFAALGLEATFHPAADIRDFTQETYTKVDRETRRRLGLWPQADAEIACWMSHHQIMQEVVEDGLNVFYVDPPIVSHDEQDDSQIERDRRLARKEHKRAEGVVLVTWRRIVSNVSHDFRRRVAFRRLLRGEIGVTPPSDKGV